jgi:hypothetical protein
MQDVTLLAPMESCFPRISKKKRETHIIMHGHQGISPLPLAAVSAPMSYGCNSFSEHSGRDALRSQQRGLYLKN